MHTSKVGGKIPDDLVSDAIAPWRTGLGADEEWVETCHQVLSGYFTLFVTLLELSIDPYPEVASCAKMVVYYIMLLLLESPFTWLLSSSLHMSSQPSIPSFHHVFGPCSHVSSLQSVPFMTPFTPSSPSCLGGIPITCPDTTTNSISRVNSSLKRTSSFANVLRSIHSYAFLTLEDNIPRVRQQHNSDY